LTAYHRLEILRYDRGGQITGRKENKDEKPGSKYSPPLSFVDLAADVDGKPAAVFPGFV